jgi:hypothetical protein
VAFIDVSLENDIALPKFGDPQNWEVLLLPVKILEDMWIMAAYEKSTNRISLYNSVGWNFTPAIVDRLKNGKHFNEIRIAQLIFIIAEVAAWTRGSDFIRFYSDPVFTDVATQNAIHVLLPTQALKEDYAGFRTFLDAEAILFKADYLPDSSSDVRMERERIVRILEELFAGIPVQKYLRRTDLSQVLPPVSLFKFSCQH